MSETRPYDIDARLLKGREGVLRCKTKRELLAEVKALEELAYGRGYSACEAKWLRRTKNNPCSSVEEWVNA